MTTEMLVQSKGETIQKKKLNLIADIQFESVEEGLCIQALHVAPMPRNLKLLKPCLCLQTKNN